MSYIDKIFSLEGKTALVTGAAGYFGKVFSRALLSAGADVILFGRGSKIECLSKELEVEYYPVPYYDVDLYDKDKFRGYLQDAILHYNVNILVNNAFDFSKGTGFNDSSGRLENISYDQWMRGLESGIYWPALATQVVGNFMSEHGSGSIINISSMYGIVSPNPVLYDGMDTVNPPSYSTAKAAILALTRYTAAFLGRYNVRCNAIAPGAFPNIDGNTYNSPKDTTIIDRLSERTLLGRYGVPDDLVGAMIFLASDASSYVTGQTITIDGGWTIT